MIIRELMTTDLSTADPDTTLEEIATIMRNDDVGAVPIIEDDELVGIITDRDIVLRCIAEGKDPSATRAEDIISEFIETIEHDADIEEAAELMSRMQIRRLPVVDNGRLVGMLSIGDIAVKQGNDNISGNTLEGVSRGVKRSSGAHTQSAATGQQKKHSKPVAQEPESKDRDISTTRSNVRGRSHNQDDKQEITSHSVEQNSSRQARVVSIRPEKKAGKNRRRAS